MEAGDEILIPCRTGTWQHYFPAEETHTHTLLAWYRKSARRARRLSKETAETGMQKLFGKKVTSFVLT
jgi:hypothetical protein